MKILALDSSAVSVSAALLDGDCLLGESFLHIPQTHSQTLMPMVEQLLENTGTSLNSVDLFAVSAGPGSFTGVRIGVSCIKGMAMAQDKPCVGVSTLEAMAYALTDAEGTVCAVMDARREQVYNACFSVAGGRLTRLTEDRALAIADLAAECAGRGRPLFLVGDGAALCFAHPAFQALDGVRLTAEPLRFPRAWGVARAAQERYATQGAVDAADLLPLYLRLPQAERELKQRLNGHREERT